MLRNHRIIVAVFLAAFSLSLLAGCGGAGQSTSTDSGQSQGTDSAKKNGSQTSSGLNDVSKLMTQEEAAKLLGQAVKPGEVKDSDNPLGQKMLIFTAASDKSAKLVQVSLVQTGGMSEAMKKSGYTAKQLYEETKKMFPDAQAVKGVGDDAFYCSSGMHVLKGDNYFALYCGSLATQEKLDPMTEAAKVVVSRLQ